MSNILILGANGQLGKEFSLALKEISPIKLDYPDFDYEKIKGLDDLERILGESNFKNIKYLIHTGAWTDTVACEGNPEKAYHFNAYIPKLLAEYCKKEKIHFIHFSTDYVFNGKKREAYTEEDPCAPLSIYGRSKLLGEFYIRDFGDIFSIFRCSSLCGVKGKNFVEAILKKAESEKKIKVVSDQIMSPTFTKDLADFVTFDILKGEGPPTGIFHFANQGACSWADLARLILKENGNEDVHVESISYKNFPSLIERPTFSVLSTEKITRITNKSIRNWQEAFKEYILMRRNCL